MVTSHGTSALFMDLENYVLGVDDSHKNKGSNNRCGATDLAYLQKVAFEEAADRRLVVQRAYADFRALGNWATNCLLSLGIEPVQVYSYSRGHPLAAKKLKNAADIRLILDVKELMHTSNSLDQIVIVAGDSDYIPLILDARRRGIEVVTLAPPEGAAERLQYHCDKYFSVEDGTKHRGMDQARMQTESVTFLTELKEEIPGIAYLGKPKWEAFVSRAFDSCKGKKPFTLTELESRILATNRKGKVRLKAEEVRGGLVQLVQCGCFRAYAEATSVNEEVNWEEINWDTFPVILDSEIIDATMVAQRAGEWLLGLLGERGCDPTLARRMLDGFHNIP